jgi:hypothetical protein
MTEPAAKARARVRKPGPGAVILGSLALFFVVLALLAFQMRAGHEPSLAAGSPQPLAPHRVLVRRVIITRVVTHLGDAPAPVAARRGTPAVPAPRPAAPAPLTTRSS